LINRRKNISYITSSFSSNFRFSENGPAILGMTISSSANCWLSITPNWFNRRNVFESVSLLSAYCFSKSPVIYFYTGRKFFALCRYRQATDSTAILTPSTKACWLAPLASGERKSLPLHPESYLRQFLCLYFSRIFDCILLFFVAANFPFFCGSSIIL